MVPTLRGAVAGDRPFGGSFRVSRERWPTDTLNVIHIDPLAKPTKQYAVRSNQKFALASRVAELIEINLPLLLQKVIYFKRV